MLPQPHACHSSTDRISCPLNPKLYSYTQDAFCKSVLTRMSGLKKGDHYCARIHQHHHVHCSVCVCLCTITHFCTFLSIKSDTVGVFYFLNVCFYLYMHSWCIVFILLACSVCDCVCVCVCLLRDAGTLECISASFKSVNTSIRSRRRGSREEQSACFSALFALSGCLCFLHFQQ